MADDLSLTVNRSFHLPIETGLRCLFLLAEISPDSCDLQRLIYYDYLLVYSGDVENGPPSLHPPLPHRGGGVLIRRPMIEKGLNLMFSKDLISKKIDDQGISYSSTELTKPFLNYLTSNYAKEIRRLAKWVAETFHSYSDQELSTYMSKNIGRWGAEFTRESILRGRKA